MTSELHNQLPEPADEPRALIDDIVADYEQQVTHSTDRYEQMLARRMVEHLESDKNPFGPQIRESFQTSIDSHPFYRASDHIRSYARALAAEQIWLRKRDFIHDIHEPADFDALISDAYEPRDGGMNTIIFRTFLRMNVLSNVTDRAKFVKLEAILGKLPQPLSVAELGASQMLNGRKLSLHMTKRSLAFAPLEVVTPEPHDDGRVRYRTVKPETGQLNTIVQRFRHEQRAYSGIDQLDPRETLVSAKAEGDSFQFNERSTGSPRLTEFTTLRRLDKLPGHSHYFADCSQPLDSEDFFRHNPELAGGADIVLLSFVLYEIPPADRAVFLENAFRIANPQTGRIMIIDNVRIDPTGSMEFPDEQGAYSTTVTVFDNARPDLGWQHRYTLETGRGHRFVIENSIGNLAVARSLGIQPSRPSDI